MTYDAERSPAARLAASKSAASRPLTEAVLDHIKFLGEVIEAERDFEAYIPAPKQELRSRLMPYDSSTHVALTNHRKLLQREVEHLILPGRKEERLASLMSKLRIPNADLLAAKISGRSRSQLRTDKELAIVKETIAEIEFDNEIHNISADDAKQQLESFGEQPLGNDQAIFEEAFRTRNLLKDGASTTRAEIKQKLLGKKPEVAAVVNDVEAVIGARPSGPSQANTWGEAATDYLILSTFKKVDLANQLDMLFPEGPQLMFEAEPEHKVSDQVRELLLVNADNSLAKLNPARSAQIVDSIDMGGLN